LNQDLAQRFFAHVKAQATGLMSDEHFTVDGTLIEAWAGQKSFRRKDDDTDGGGGGGDFRGEQRRNQTHASSTVVVRGLILRPKDCGYCEKMPHGLRLLYHD
jgi:hypothetical protein